MRQRGFTLPELVIVIVIAGIIAATLSTFFRPAIDSWLALRVRANLTDHAATALNAMRRDVRVAVPNSIRTPSTSCFELVPTTSGGRFRMAPDIAGGSAWLDLSSSSSTQFDTFNALAATPSTGDWVVIDNQNPGDVYAGGVNRAAIASIAAAPSGKGQQRITLASGFLRPGYDQGRFVVVPDSQQAIFYVCSNAGEANGEGTGTLTRYSHYGFNSAYPSSCSAPSAAGSVLATKVRSCRFVYDPNQGATQQSGFVSMQLELESASEIVSLMMGAHVLNAP